MYRCRAGVLAVACLSVATATLSSPASAARAAATAASFNYQVQVNPGSISPQPLVSWQGGNSDFYEAFNPSWIDAPSSASGAQAGAQAGAQGCGLLIRSQNCSASPGACVKCNGPGQARSRLAFAAQQHPSCGDAGQPTFAPIGAATVVFGPQSDVDKHGTEDPRVVRLRNGTYVMLYTAFGVVGDNNFSVLLSIASTETPTVPGSWRRLGAVFPGRQGSKSGALVVRDAPPHYLYWGDSDIHVARCDDDDLLHWTDVGVLLSPRADAFDSKLVESGPPPFLLSTGDLFFLHNSANDTLGYHPGWVVTSGKDPTKVLARSNEPLLTPNTTWTTGAPPSLCNVPNVVFLEAAHPTPNVDEYRVFFGGSDAVIGSAVVTVTHY